DYIILLSMHY
ncbi:hypothetical protein LSF16_24400, partial [Bacillus cereus]